MKYNLVTTFDDDLRNVKSGLSLEGTLQEMLDAIQQNGTVWFMVEKKES